MGGGQEGVCQGMILTAVTHPFCKTTRARKMVYSNRKRMLFPSSFDPSLHPLRQRLLHIVDASLNVRALPSLSHAREVHLFETVQSNGVGEL